MATLVAATALVVYSGSLDNGFVWDDRVVLEDQMVAFQTLGDAFSPPANIFSYSEHYYRPLVIVSYMIDKALTGPRPVEIPKGKLNPFHLSVVIYHAFVTVSVLLFGVVLLSHRWWGQWAALFAAMLFAVHPIHTESVCWMAGRSDVLAAVGVAPALLFYLIGRRTGSFVWVIAAVAAYSFAILSKETAVSFLIALPLIDMLVSREQRDLTKDTLLVQQSSSSTAPIAKSQASKSQTSWWSGMLFRYALFGVATVAYWMLRHQALGGQKDSPISASQAIFGADVQASSSSVTTLMGNLFGSIGYYFKKTFLPLPLNAFPAESTATPLLIALGLIGIVAGCLLAWWAWRRGDLIIVLLLGLFLGTLSPSCVVALGAISKTPVAERYLYLPSIAACIGVAYAAGVMAEWISVKASRAACRKASVVAGVFALVVFGLYATATIQRNSVWEDELSFWTDAVAKSPHQGLPHMGLGLAYSLLAYEEPAKMRHYEELSVQEYLIAIDEQKVQNDRDGRSAAFCNLGMTYLKWQEIDKAEQKLRSSLALDPGYAPANYGMGRVYLQRALQSANDQDGNHLTALSHFRKARDWTRRSLVINPQYVVAHLHLATVLTYLEEYELAMKHLQEVIRLEPGTIFASDAESKLKLIAPWAAETKAAETK